MGTGRGTAAPVLSKVTRKQPTTGLERAGMSCAKQQLDRSPRCWAGGLASWRRHHLSTWSSQPRSASQPRTWIGFAGVPRALASFCLQQSLGACKTRHPRSLHLAFSCTHHPLGKMQARTASVRGRDRTVWARKGGGGGSLQAWLPRVGVGTTAARRRWCLCVLAACDAERS